MYSIQQLRDIYSISWAPFGGRRNPTRRLKVLRAIPALAIAGLFRASEVLRPAGTAFNPLIHLTRGHITFHADDRAWTPIAPTPANLTRLLRERRGVAKVRIPKLKNDQNMDQGFEPVVLTFSSPGAPFCTLSLLIELELDQPLPANSTRSTTPMFVDPDTGRQFVKSTFASIFTKLISRALVQCHNITMSDKEIRKLYSLHSFRVTGANLLRAAGAPSWALKRAGRWLSDCHLEYDRDDLDLMCRLRRGMFSTRSTAPHVPLPSAGTYPYPKETLHPSLPMPPPARAMNGPGTFTVRPDQELEWERAGNYEPSQTAENRTRYDSLTPSVTDIVGRKIRKRLGRYWSIGTIDRSSAKESTVHVTFSDGHEENLDLAVAYTLLVPQHHEESSAKRRRT